MARHFVKKNKGGPGNPFCKYVLRFRKSLMTCITKEQFEALIMRVYDEAIGGDMNAAKLLIERLCGPATQQIDISTGGRPFAVIELPMREFEKEDDEVETVDGKVLGDEPPKLNGKHS